MLETMSNAGSVLGAPVGGLLLDMFFGKSLGLPDPLNGNIVPFVISGLLGMFTVALVQILVKEKVTAKRGIPPG